MKSHRMLLHNSYSPPPQGFQPLVDDGYWCFGYFISYAPNGESFKIYTSVLSKYIQKVPDPLYSIIAMYEAAYGKE